MHLRRLTLPAVVACVVAVAIPVPAAAAPAQCSVVMPTKVVINAKTVQTPVRLASNCTAAGADYAYWDVVHRTGAEFRQDFEPGAGDTWNSLRWYDDDPKGTWITTGVEAAQADGDLLTQNRAVTRVKYASRITATVSRKSTTLSWTAAASSWSGALHRYYPRARTTLSLWHLPSGSGTWKWVKAVKTSSTGRATITMTRPKAGMYRLSVGETPSMWGAWTRPIRGRV